MLRLILPIIILFLSINSFAQSACDSCWIKTELYFGMSIPTGGKVSQCKWNKFVKENITPNFPEGSTILKAKGQWLDDSTKTTISEKSRVFIVVYTQSQQQDTDEKLKQISSAYIKLFNQQGVMRVDEEVQVQFYAQ